MLKKEEILKNLTIEQKLSLLADFNALGDASEGEFGVKFVKTINAFKHQVFNEYPAPESLINSFDDKLFSDVADDIAIKVKGDGVTLMGIPSANVKGSVYSKGYTEDPVLASSFALQFAGVSDRVGIKTFISEPYLTEDAVRVSDVNYNERATKEFFLKPIYEVLKKVNLVMPKQVPCTDNYSKANEELSEQISSSCEIIIEKANGEETLAHACKKDAFVKNGSLPALKDAFARYKTCWKAFEDGEISLSDVETACRSGNALSPKMIDEAVERIIELSISCAKDIDNKKPVPKPASLPLKATEESIVMLKNDEVLPIKRKRVAVIGDLAEYSQSGEKTLKYCIEKYGKNLRFNGYSKGYEGYKLINKNLIKLAVSEARKAEVIIVALGQDNIFAEKSRKGGNSNLPANQIALLEALKETGKKIVALVYGLYPDMKFDKYCDAILLAPIGCQYSAEALCNVLSGAVSPSGRLANSCYENTDEFMENLRKYKNAGRNEVGTFYGYRYYDTAKIKQKYPFGFGLTYSKFVYSGLRVNNDQISFHVKNKGKFDASEVVQIYVGKKDSSIIRPEKELKFFKKISLKSGRSTKVVVNRKDLDLSVFDDKAKQFVNEIGSYEIYVGSSISDIHLNGKIYINGAKLEKDGKKPSDYFQNVSNIKDKKYYLDVPMKVPKESFEKRRKFTYVLSAVMICLAIIYLYFDFIGWVPNLLVIHLTMLGITILPIISALILTMRKVKFINKHMEISKNMKKELREKLNQDELENELPFEMLFVEEFKEEEVRFSEDEETEEVIEEKEVKIQTFDSEFTLDVVCSDIISFAQEKELILDPVCVRSLVSAFASSKLIVMNYEDKYIYDRFIEVLGQYLGKKITIDDFDAIKNDGGDVLTYKKDLEESINLTNVASALIDTSIDDERIRVMAIDNARTSYLKSYLTHIFKYIDSPDKQTQIYVRSDTIDEHFDIPSNVWFIMTLAEGEKITDIPKFILDTVCVVDLIAREPKETELKRKKKIEIEVPKPAAKETTEEVISNEEQAEVVSEEQTAKETEEESYVEPESVKLTFYQFSKLVAHAIRDCLLDENLWKRVDKLEDYVGKKESYKIDNKQWHRIEKYVSSYIATGGQQEEALDSVFAHHVVYGMLPILVNNKDKNDDKFTHVIENVFGEGHAPFSIKVVKSTGMNV